ncbi:hypothetical protein, partial [Xanthomonas euvesicatoria]|uniref:hypothetical protein n=1 Tax=Xanthomonas euvesicatoria TaxID=456327 RepID=UPI001C20B615
NRDWGFVKAALRVIHLSTAEAPSPTGSLRQPYRALKDAEAAAADKLANARFKRIPNPKSPHPGA